VPKVLGAGETETGFWSASVPGVATKGRRVNGEISFPIPLEAGLNAEHVVLVAEHATGTGGCEGGTVSAPTAKPGYLCVYIGHETVTGTVAFKAIENAAGSTGASPTGAVVSFEATGEGENTLQVVGTWAVTAP